MALARQLVDTCPKQIQNPHKCQGSWHSKRKLACQYCRAVAFLDPGESEDFLYTAFGHNAAHRSTYLIQPFLISSFWLEIPRKRSHNLKLLICSILTLLNGFTLPLFISHRLVEDAADWIAIHGNVPICTIPGFSPWRDLEHSTWYIDGFRFSRLHFI